MGLAITPIERAAAHEVPARRGLTLVGLLFVTHLFLLGFFKVSTFDTWSHLKEGELYAATGSRLFHHQFAFTIASSCLADVPFYLTYTAAGLPRLVPFRVIVLFAVAWLFYHICRQCDLYPLTAILLG